MPVYAKDRARRRWRVVVHSKGERHDRIVEGSKADAEAYEARLRIELATLAPVAARATPTFSNFCRETYAPHAQLHLKPYTYSKQRYHLAELIKNLGDLRLNEIGTDVVEAYKRTRLADGLRPVSVNNETRVLRRVLRVAAERGHLVASPAFRALPERGSKHRDAWSDAELAALFTKAEELSPELLPMVVFIANTGARRGEAMALTWDHVDLERGLIRIWPSEEWQPKSGKPREVPISDVLRAELEQRPRTSRFVYPASTGDRFATWPQLQFDRARKAAGLKGGPHTLRHTFATHFLRVCPDLYLLARILGHSDVAVTRLYAHLLPDHLARARNAVNVGPPSKTLPTSLPSRETLERLRRLSCGI